MDARLTPTLGALWPWLLLDDPTMEAVLELLCVHTANCPPGLHVFVCLVLSILSVCTVIVPGPCLSVVSNLTESCTLCIKSSIVLSKDGIVFHSNGQLVATIVAVSGLIRLLVCLIIVCALSRKCTLHV